MSVSCSNNPPSATLFRQAIVCLGCLMALGCGSRTALIEDFDESDASVDTPIDIRQDPFTDPPIDRDVPDVPPDVDPDAPPPQRLVVDCGRPEEATVPNRPVTVQGSFEVEGGVSAVSENWFLTDQPPMANATLVSMGSSATLTPDTIGPHLLTYEVEVEFDDGELISETCEVVVDAVFGPPRALCPAQVRAPVGQPTPIMGDGFDDMAVTSFSWEIVGTPMGAVARLDPLDVSMPIFVADTVGEYRLLLTVADADGAEDSCELTVLVTGPPVVECPMSPLSVPTRQPAMVTARADDETGIDRVTWEVNSVPPNASPAVSVAGNVLTITPDKQGEYQLTFTAFDTDGLSASCNVLLIGEPTPPDVTCPAVIETRPLSTVELQGVVEDDGDSFEASWFLRTPAVGSNAAEPTPSDNINAMFTPDIAGEYELQLSVQDEDGMRGTCTTTVRALALEGLRVEMFWDTDSTDMDLHLLNPEATQWYGEDDCYYLNCDDQARPWGGPGVDDDPSLDIDDTDGFGPENINIEVPARGEYRIGVEAFSGRADAVTVRVYCGGSSTTPRFTFGPVSLRGNNGSGSDDFWRVADVTIDAIGDCSAVDLGAGGTPNIRPRRNAESNR